VIKAYYKLITILFGALGLACSKSVDNTVEYAPLPEYGVPVAHYRISGVVKRADTGAPLNGIGLFFKAVHTQSNQAGLWSIGAEGLGCGYDAFPPCSLEVVDTDGPDGGSFQSTWVVLNLIQTEPGDGVFDLGKFEQHDLEIELVEER
jgi:hypothetical protein